MADSVNVPAPLRAQYDSLVTTGASFRKRLGTSIESDTASDLGDVPFTRIVPFKLDFLLSNVGGATTPASATDLAMWAELQREVPAAIDDVNAFLARVTPFYVKLAEAGLQPRLPKVIEKP
jgi:hypothetical protein